MELRSAATVCTLLSLASSYWLGMGNGQVEGPGLCRGLLPTLLPRLLGPLMLGSCDSPTKAPKSAESLHHTDTLTALVAQVYGPMAVQKAAPYTAPNAAGPTHSGLM